MCAEAQHAPGTSAKQASKENDHTLEPAIVEIMEKAESGSIEEDEASLIQSIQQKELGGARPPSGSAAAEAQSLVAIKENFYEVAKEIGDKLLHNPDSISFDDIRLLQSRHAKLTDVTDAKNRGSAVKESFDKATSTQRNAATPGGSNHKERPAIPSDGNAVRLDPSEQSHRDRERNFQHIASHVKDELEHHPEDLTKEEVRSLERADHRAHGAIEKGNITAQAQSFIDKKEVEAQQHHVPAETEPAEPTGQTARSDQAAQTEFQEAALAIRTKLNEDSNGVSPDEANHLHGLEQRAQGHTAKGGITAEAMKAVASKE